MAANLQSMFHYWKEFDLQALQKELDTTATELAARQDDSELARKHLVEQSREFKKNAVEEVRKNVAPLLKSFQAEIDNLSKRSKNAEGAFLSVYKRLIDAPDPGAVLEHALQLQKRAQKVQDLEIENKQLRETLEEYNHEFAEVKNQEVTIKNLREQLKEYEDRMEANAQARAKEKEKELQRAFAEKERQLQETQLAVAKKLGEAEHKVATLQSALDCTQSELFDLKAKYDEATSAKSDEMEMIMADLERANERAASAERTVEQLNQQLASATQNLQQAQQMQKAPDMEQAIDILKRSSLEVELAAKEKEIAQLVEDVQRLQATVNKLRDTSASMVARLEEELVTKTQNLKVMEDKLSNQSDYEEIKRELSLLKSIEFGSSGAPEDSGIQDPGTPGTPPSGKPKTLETLLLEKNRNLQSENTQLKVSNNDLTDSPVPATTPVSCKPTSSTPSACSTVSSVSVSSNISNTEMFASMIGHELVAQYHLQNQLRLGLEGMAVAAQLGVPPNGFIPGFLPPPPLLPPPPPPATSSPSTPLLNGHTPINIVPGHESPLERIHNIAKSELNNAQVLDTADVAQRIRELLSSHNIGQRLFAKHVLGLSQGTVSELLSKPKHWDKLTEKGRESYRKMALWANDENNVLALKAIAPKKGNQPVSTNNKGEDTHTEERINQILSEAQVAMQTKHGQDKNHAANAMVASIYEQELAKLSQQEHRKYGFKLPKSEPREDLNGSVDSNGHWTESSGHSPRGRKPQTDSSNLTQEMVARIYQAELMKLAQAAEQSGNLAECHMYRQELARLATNAKQKTESQPPSQPQSPIKWEPQGENKENQREDDKENNVAIRLTIKREPQEGERQENKENVLSSPSPSQNVPQDLSTSSSSEAVRHNGSAFCLVHPRSNSQNGIDAAQMGPLTTTSDSMSPLQRMQSIANSLMAKNNAQVQNQRPLRAVLPPITQEQFDAYPNINTDDLVKKMKDGLSQFSISQRLFGESVLGLSQGSVSDLLARPKPWHMLTQKGREPFIRMQIFLEDADSIPKLVATQYRISPEQFLRTEPFDFEMQGNTIRILSAGKPATKTVTTTTTIPSPAVSDTPMTPETSTSNAPPSIVIISSNQCSMPTTTMTTSKSMTRQKAPPPPPPLPPMPMLGLPPLQSFPHPIMISGGSPPGVIPSPSPVPTSTGPKNLDMPMLPIQPSVFEIAAMTNELDTVTITCRVKEVLQYHNLGQKLFGEAVLGLSQGSVSELLSKPKPWHMLSLKGREPFIKMHMWLSDPFSVDRLRIYQNELKAKRRRTSTEERENVSASKKPRVYFSEEQKDLLRMSYAKDPYPNQAKIEHLADTLAVGTKTIVNWFHNHRMRNKHANSPSMVSPPTPTHSTKSEPEDWSNQSNQSDQSQPGPPSANMTQWMFPSFEKVLVNGQYMSPGSIRPGMDKAQDLSMTRPQSVERRNDSTSSSGSSLSPCRKSGSTPPPTGMAASQPSIETKETRPQTTGNRRKSSHPKWVYEGTQLDKSMHGDDLKAVDLQPQDLSCRTNEAESPTFSYVTPRQDEREIEAMNTDNNNDKNKTSVNTPQDSNSTASLPEEEKLKMSQTIASNDRDWDDINHQDKIQKIQQNLTTESGRYTKLQEQYSEVVGCMQEQKQLITQLEEDLRSVNALSSMFRGDAEGEAVTQCQSAEFVADAVKDLAQASVNQMDPVKSAADALLPIVQSQRERFRTRNQELEAQTVGMQQQIQFLQNEMDKLRSDNVKLYEKIKFVQSYPHKGVTSGKVDDTERKYLIQYEEKLDPFSRFSHKERQRKYMNLNPYDKISLSMGRFVLGNKMARTVVFFYTIFLHILVFLVLYKMAYTSSCKRDLAAECHQKFAEHMAKVHGDTEWHDHHW